jgi:superoxide dismutase, Cu-Zn family
VRRFRGVLASASMLALSILALIGGGVTTTHISAAQGNDEVVAAMINQDGVQIGTVGFAWEGDYVRVRADVRDLPPGFHGFHVHANGVCDPSVGFDSAGGHLNPSGDHHADHAGDMPSLYVTGDGTGSLRALLDRVLVSQLVEDGGHAVIIHADPDNFANIPARYGVVPDEATLNTGDAGGRIACGVIRPR